MVVTGEGAFSGARRRRIAYRTWARSSPRPPRAVVVVVHTIYDHSARYDEFACNLVRFGINVWALDLPGHGLSDGQRGVIEDFADVAADIGRLVEIARNQHGTPPCFLVAHSVGALGGLSFALEHQGTLAGLICTAPAIDHKLLPGPLQSLLDKLVGSPVVARVSARVRTFSLDPAQATSDPAEVRALAEDPLIQRGRVPLTTAHAIARVLRGTLAGRLGEITVPVLVVHGELDRIVPPSAARDLYDRVGSADKTLRLLPGMSHAIFHEQKALRRRSNDMIGEWIDERAAPVRDGAAGEGKPV